MRAKKNVENFAIVSGYHFEMGQDGKLIKRPFLLTPKGGTVGFDPAVWEALVGD